MYYVIENHGTARHYHVSSAQFFHSLDMLVYPLARIRSLTLDFNWLDFTWGVRESVYGVKWEMYNINRFCGKTLLDPLFAIIIKEKRSVLCYQKSWYGWSLSCLFCSIFPFSGYTCRSASVDMFSVVGFQLFGFHVMGRRECIRGTIGDLKY